MTYLWEQVEYAKKGSSHGSKSRDVDPVAARRSAGSRALFDIGSRLLRRALPNARALELSYTP
jgi:hypothetical protein